VLCDPTAASFGGGQMVLVRDDVLIGGSESRKDGVALGY
jgi:gamma-glutamyltranspeptidase